MYGDVSSGEIIVLSNFLSSNFCDKVYPARPVPMITREVLDIFAKVAVAVALKDRSESAAASPLDLWNNYVCDFRDHCSHLLTVVDYNDTGPRRGTTWSQDLTMQGRLRGSKPSGRVGANHERAHEMHRIFLDDPALYGFQRANVLLL